MTRLIIANWKMNPETLVEARHLVVGVEQGLFGLDRRGVEVAICPPFVFLPALMHSLHFATLGAQNVSAQEKGPYTGEVSAGQLSALQVRFAIVGHSERRALGEDNEFINEKIKICLKRKIEPILCVGFGVKKNMSEQAVKKFIKKQLREDLRGLDAKLKTTVAYEPAWGISTGLGSAKTISVQHCVNIIEFIKEQTPRARVIYGASVTSKNASELASHNSIEGCLVGGASLDATEFLKIIKEFSN